MAWLWYLPLILTATLVVTFYPLLTRKGHQPLHAGLEGDPRCQLEDQRELLLRQLKEVEYDTATGALRGENVAALRAGLEQELARVLDGLEKPANETVATTPVTVTNRGVDVASGIAVVLAVTLMASGVYWYLGVPVAPQSTGHGPQGAAGELSAMVEGLAQRLRNEPDNLEGWLRLGRSYAVMNRLPEAMAAYTHILSRQPDNVDAAVAIAALQVRSQDGEAVRQGLEMFESILAKHPEQPDALWYTGIKAFDSGDTSRALALWQKLRDLLPPGSKGRQTVEEAINEAQSAPAAGR